MSTQPIRPSDIGEAKSKVIPPQVIAIFNELIAKHYSGGRAVVKQADVMSEIEHRIEGPDTEEMRAAWRQNVVIPWLNIEELYEAAGWTVSYDKPGYCESYPATFTFTPKSA